MSLSLYIHFPFCTNICSYCDFFKVPYDEPLEKTYFDALEAELLLIKDTIDPELRKLETIYIGGGTPSLINLSLLEHFLDRLRKFFEMPGEMEFSFEINPESIDSDRLAVIKELGVNRPIFGIQSFNVGLLTLLNRKHNLNDSFRAVYLARALGFDNFGIDMIFGLPKQTVRNLSDDLNQLVDLAPPHVSYYQLTVEKNTPLDTKIKDGTLQVPDSDLSAAMYRAINEELKGHGCFRYEISSYALPGYECKHNLRYWEGGDFLGLGPAAHSFIGNRRFANTSDLKLYLDSLSEHRRPLIFDADNEDSRIIETIMLGLRTTRGIARRAFQNRFGIPLEKVMDMASLKAMREANLIDSDEDSLKLSESGFLVADEIIRRLVK